MSAWMVTSYLLPYVWRGYFRQGAWLRRPVFGAWARVSRGAPCSPTTAPGYWTPAA